MTSGPYQSKLLRLAIAQYRQGVDRHHRAVRQARSTAALGVELGTVLALTPVSAAMKVVQNAGAKVRRAVSEGGWFALATDGMKTDATKLLDFSDFKEAATEPKDVVGLASLTGTALAESSMVQTLREVGLCLSSRQVKALLQSDEARVHNPSERFTLASIPLVGRLVSFGHRSVAGFLRRTDVKDREPENAGGEIAATQPFGVGVLKVTGVASDLETRSLHLVLGHTVIWDGLTVRQQAQLQQKILRLLEGNTEQHDFLSATICALQASSVAALIGKQSALTRPVHDFWVEVLRAVTWLKQRYGRRPISRLTGNQEAIEGVNSTANRVVLVTSHWIAFAEKAMLPSVSIETGLSGTGTGLLPVLEGEQMVVASRDKRSIFKQTTREQRSVVLVPEGMATAQSQRNQADYWETDIIAVDYIEHPLETVLKWVDRILLWVEAQWQTLTRWLSQLVRRLGTDL